MKSETFGALLIVIIITGVCVWFWKSTDIMMKNTDRMFNTEQR